MSTTAARANPESCEKLLIAATGRSVSVATLRRRLTELRDAHHSALARTLADDREWLADAEGELAVKAAAAPRFGRLRSFFGSNDESYRAYRAARLALRDRRRRADVDEARLKREIDDAESGLEEQLEDRAVALVRESLRRPARRWAGRLIATVQYFDVTEDGAGVQALVEVVAPGRDSRIRVLLVADVARPIGALLNDVAESERNPYLYDEFLPGSVVDERTLRAVPHSSLERRVRELGLIDVGDEVVEAVAQRAAISPDLRRQIDQVLGFALKRPDYAANADLLRTYLKHWAYAGHLVPEAMLRSSLLLDALTGQKRNQARVAAAIAAESEASRAGEFNPGMVIARIRRGLIAAPPSAARTIDRAGDDWMVYYLTFAKDSGGGPHPCVLDQASPNYRRLCAANGGPHFGDPRAIGDGSAPGG